MLLGRGNPAKATQPSLRGRGPMPWRCLPEPSRCGAGGRSWLISCVSLTAPGRARTSGCVCEASGSRAHCPGPALWKVYGSLTESRGPTLWARCQGAEHPQRGRAVAGTGAAHPPGSPAPGQTGLHCRHLVPASGVQQRPQHIHRLPGLSQRS